MLALPWDEQADQANDKSIALNAVFVPEGLPIGLQVKAVQLDTVVDVGALVIGDTDTANAVRHPA